MRRIADLSMLFFGINLMSEIDTPTIEIGDHCLNFVHPPAALIDLGLFNMAQTFIRVCFHEALPKLPHIEA